MYSFIIFPTLLPVISNYSYRHLFKNWQNGSVRTCTVGGPYKKRKQTAHQSRYSVFIKGSTTSKKTLQPLRQICLQKEYKHERYSVQIAPEKIVMYIKMTTKCNVWEKCNNRETLTWRLETKTSPSKWGFPQQLQNQLIYKKCPKWTKVYLIWLKKHLKKKNYNQ